MLVTSAAMEWGAGVGLAVAPSLTASVLVGGSLDTPAAASVGRIAGAALIALGTACWLVRGQERNPVAAALVIAMLIYNSGVAAILIVAGTVLGLAGVGLWPTVVLHLCMAAWCLSSVLSKRATVPARGR